MHEKEFRAALRLQPGVTEWRLSLRRALATRGPLAHEVLRSLLAARGVMNAAMRELQTALRLPQIPNAGERRFCRGEEPAEWLSHESSPGLADR
jgi:hypothetical protein